MTGPVQQIQAAVATLASVEGVRQRLMNQAAALLWAIWGFVLLGIGLAAHVQTLAAVHLDYSTQWIGFGAIVVLAAAGALVTKGVYGMLSIDTGRQAWMSWLIGAVALMSLSGLVALSNLVAPAGSGEDALMLAPVCLVGALIAVILSIHMRVTITMAPGLWAAAVLTVGFLNARFADFGGGIVVDVANNLGLVFFVFLVFLVVGVVLYRRG